jgi:HlyD family secretion protein
VNSRKKNSRRWLLVLVLILVGGAAFYQYSLGLAEGEASVDPALTVPVQRATITRSVVATGTIEPISNRVELMSKASGIVKAINVDVGDRVYVGQVLVELDRDQLLALLREEEANLASAEADLKSKQAEFTRHEILAEGHEVELARKEAERVQALAAQGLVSRSQLDVADGKLEEAQNQQRAAQAMVDVSDAAISQKSAEIVKVQATIERIREELKYTTIRSPIEGVVLARGSTHGPDAAVRSLEVGSAVSSILTMGQGATVVMTLGDMRRVYVRGHVTESDIGEVREGQQARITVEALRGRALEGKVYKISPLGMEENSVTTFEVRVTVDNPDGLLRASMSANAEILLDEREDALLVPEAAVTYDANRRPVVEIVDESDPNGKRVVPVEIGITDGANAEILSGLTETDRVVLP